MSLSSPENIVSLAVLQVEMEQVKAELAANTEATKELIAAWNAAGKVIAFIKLCASLIAALGAIWLFMKTGFTKGGG